MSRTTLQPPRRSRRSAAAAAALAVAAPLALAACSDDTSSASDDGPWEPERDIEWIVPYTPGGGFDTYSRGIAEIMQQSHLPDGVNIVVRNSPPLPRASPRCSTRTPTATRSASCRCPPRSRRRSRSPTSRSGRPAS